jgi:hypothetical protein
MADVFEKLTHPATSESQPSAACDAEFFCDLHHFF